MSMVAEGPRIRSGEAGAVERRGLKRSNRANPSGGSVALSGGRGPPGRPAPLPAGSPSVSHDQPSGAPPAGAGRTGSVQQIGSAPAPVQTNFHRVKPRARHPLPGPLGDRPAETIERDPDAGPSRPTSPVPPARTALAAIAPGGADLSQRGRGWRRPAIRRQRPDSPEWSPRRLASPWPSDPADQGSSPLHSNVNDCHEMPPRRSTAPICASAPILHSFPRRIFVGSMGSMAEHGRPIGRTPPVGPGNATTDACKRPPTSRPSAPIAAPEPMRRDFPPRVGLLIHAKHANHGEQGRPSGGRRGPERCPSGTRSPGGAGPDRRPAATGRDLRGEPPGRRA
jgi:hypothetical protein